jgi:hypothetical protein
VSTTSISSCTSTTSRRHSPLQRALHSAEAADAVGADLYVHGHAHAGTEHGMTAGGIRVRNVAQPVLRRPCAFYRLREDEPTREPQVA